MIPALARLLAMEMPPPTWRDADARDARLHTQRAGDCTRPRLRPIDVIRDLTICITFEAFDQ